jgi:hypothetical protein
LKELSVKADDIGRPEPKPVSRSVGVIYVAIRASFVLEARLSAGSVRRFLPGVPIVLFTDQKLNDNYGFDEVVHLPETHPKYHINKLIAAAQSPFEKTLLLDTDTYVCADISDLFAVLDRFDIAMTHDRGYIDNFPANTGVPDAFVEFNQGVIAFRRSDAVRKALQEALIWMERLHSRSGAYTHDQPPFRVALFHSDARIATLPLEYNCRFESYGYLNGVVRILHGRLPNRRMLAQDYERVARMLNRVTVPRVHMKGAIFAMSRTNLLGREYYARTLVGHYFRPSIAFMRGVLVSLRNGPFKAGVVDWLRRVVRRGLQLRR